MNDAQAFRISKISSLPIRSSAFWQLVSDHSISVFSPRPLALIVRVVARRFA